MDSEVLEEEDLTAPGMAACRASACGIGSWMPEVPVSMSTGIDEKEGMSAAQFNH